MHARLPPAPCNSPFNAKAASRSPCKVMAGKLAAAVATIDKSSAPACAHLQAGMDWNYEMQRSPAAPCLETDLDQAVGRHAGQSRGEAGDSQAPAGSTPFASYRPGCGAAADPAGIAWPSQELSAADEASHWERLVSDAAALHRETLRLAQDAQPLQSMRSLRRIRTVSDEATDDGPGLKSVGSLSLSTALSRQMSARISALRAEQPGGMVGLDAAHNEPRLHSRLSSGAASLPDAMSILEAEALSPLTRVQDVPPSRQAPSPQLGDSSSLLRGLMKDLQTLRRRGGAMPAGDESRHETETLLSGSRLEEVVTSLYCLAGSVAGVLAWIQA
ncbi:hypothetical protein WJX72_005767 [[Myrmecia] bisecta]|uniref:Uncharacterized protein n=1 Tax=[Myrmecia] bisecta TaxID=41462 RepID=A0AAW1Q151_9CHLO